MKSRYALLASVLFGLLAMWGLRKFLTDEKSKLERAEEQSAVLVAAVDLGKDRLVQLEDLEPGKIPRRFYNEEAMLTPSDKPKVARKKLRISVPKGVPLYWKDFEEPSPFLEVSSLKAGERLITVAVDYTTGVGGNLLPGSFVDVVAILRGGGDAAGERATTVLERMRVFSVGPTDVSRSGYGLLPQQYSAVTLVASPQEAEILAYCQAQGRLTLVKRGELDASLSGRSKGVAGATLEQEIQSARQRREGAAK